MLFKLVSNGKTTVAELDGKVLCAVNGLSFEYWKDGDEQKTRLKLDFDTSAAKEGQDETGTNIGIFLKEKNGRFESMASSIEAVEIQKIAGRYDESRESFSERLKLIRSLREEKLRMKDQNISE